MKLAIKYIPFACMVILAGLTFSTAQAQIQKDDCSVPPEDCSAPPISDAPIIKDMSPHCNGEVNVYSFSSQPRVHSREIYYLITPNGIFSTPIEENLDGDFWTAKQYYTQVFKGVCKSGLFDGVQHGCASINIVMRGFVDDEYTDKTKLRFKNCKH